MGFAPQTDAVLLVVDATQTTAEAVKACETAVRGPHPGSGGGAEPIAGSRVVAVTDTVAGSVRSWVPSRRLKEFLGLLWRRRLLIAAITVALTVVIV